MIEYGEHVSIFGITGSGKSTLTRQVAAYFGRLVVFDRLGEWENYPGAEISRTVAEFVDSFRRHLCSDQFTLVFRFQPGSDADGNVAICEAILSRIYAYEIQARRGVALIFEEVWLYASPHFMGAWLSETILTGRHARISLIANAQRPASVHKTLVSQSRHVFIGQHHEARDQLYFRETIGDLPELRAPIPRFHFLWFRPNGEKPALLRTDPADSA